MAGFMAMRFQEVKGHWPLMKPKKVDGAASPSETSEVKA